MRALTGTRAAPAVLAAGPAPLPVTAGLILTASSPRPRPLRRPPEHHPLQNRQVSAQPLQLSRLLRVLLPKPGVLLAQLTRQPRQLLVRLQCRSQHILGRRLSIRQIQDNPCRNRHAAQQTPSPAANHAPRLPCRATARPTPPHDFRILTTRVDLGKSEALLHVSFPSVAKCRSHAAPNSSLRED